MSSFTVSSLHAVLRVIVCALAFASANRAFAESPYRTDGGDEKLAWFELVPGQFPPEGSAHYFSGELIETEHLERRFILRVDRTDSQNRSHFDLPTAAQMLPYGSISYHGAPAAFEDIPLGTHLHGWFYLKDPNDTTPPLEGWHNRKSYEIDFTRCIQLEDDFSYRMRLGQSYRVTGIDKENSKLTAALVDEGEVIGDPIEFELLPSTRLWKGTGIARLDDLQRDQEVLFNMTWATLYGAGRITEIWLDAESRLVATDHQGAKHRQYIRERGLPGWVDEVDNANRIVTLTLFGNVDAALLDEIKLKDTVGVAVAEPNLLTYDPVNDRKRGPVLDIRDVPKTPGSSGIQVDVQPDLLLEGYRPGRIVRIYPSGWKVIALPKEYELFGR